MVNQKKHVLRPLTTNETKNINKNNLIHLENQFQKVLPKINFNQKKKEENIYVDTRPRLKGSQIHIIQPKEILSKIENSHISPNKMKKNTIEYNNKKISTAPSREIFKKIQINLRPLNKIYSNEGNKHEKVFHESKSNEKYRNKIFNLSKDKENNLILPKIDNNNDWIKVKLNNINKKQSNDFLKLDFLKRNLTIKSNLLNPNLKRNDPKYVKKQTR